jgi:phage shock protein A
MASLLERVRTLVSANLNYLVSQALKAKTMRRKYDEYTRKSDELDRNIDLFLREGKESLAMAAQSRLNTTRRVAESYAEQAQQQESEFQKLLDAKLKLEAKLTEVRQERAELEAMIELAKSKELTHKVVNGVAGVTTSDAGVNEMREAIQRRLDKASAQSEMDSRRLESQMAEVLEQDLLQRQLEDRKKKLGMEG